MTRNRAAVNEMVSIINITPSDYALFRHMTAEQNVANETSAEFQVFRAGTSHGDDGHFQDRATAADRK
jgi:hypothetical protein